jgi:hypothetical protein
MKKNNYILISSVLLIIFVSLFSSLGAANYDYSIPYTVVEPTPSITVNLTASPSSMDLPDNEVQLRWETTGDPTSCVASNAWSGNKNVPSDSETISGLIAGTYVFDITCSRAGYLDGTDSAIVVVNPPSTPTGSLVADDCLIPAGSSSCSSSVSWSTLNLTANPTAITRDVGLPASFTPSPLSGGSQSVTLDYGTTNFYLYHNSVELAQDPAVASCAPGSTWNNSICLLNTPSVTLTVLPSSINSGDSSTISWISENVSSCSASATPANPSWTGSKATSSTFPHESTGALYATTTFNISCTGPAGSANDSKVVTVYPSLTVTADLTASPTNVNSGDPSTLSWSSTNATSCSGIGFNTGGIPAGSIVVNPTVNTTYTLNCVNGINTAVDQATVTIKKKFLFIEF